MVKICLNINVEYLSGLTLLSVVRLLNILDKMLASLIN
jgi:hypothetical protein